MPGQVFSFGILDYMDVLDTREVHGYREGDGYRVFADGLDGAPDPAGSPTRAA